MNRPFVSVVMITYGHEMYIQQAIESILVQECNFEIELIISNDCSPDGTDAIVAAIINSNPKAALIKYTHHKINLGIMPNFIWALQQAKGEYIAICEGDDYWTDSHKLQKQIDYLSKNPNCSLSFHSSEHLNEDNPNYSFIHRPAAIPQNKQFGMNNVILEGGGFITTNSMVFRKESIAALPEWFTKAPVGDLPLMLLLATKGKIGYIDDVMSTYRVMAQNSWSATLQNKEKKKKHYHAILKMWSDFDTWTKYKYHRIIIRKKIKNTYSYWKQILYIEKQLVLKKIKSNR